MKKENITIESVSNNFNNIYDVIVNLKNIIEKEIDKINILYETTMDNLAKSFLKKQEQLLKEENELKEKLQIEVTKSKEKLETYLSTSIDDIKLSERLKKGIKKMKDKEENILKIISYVSKANQTQKEMINLSKQLMQNIKFNFDDNKNEINFEKYIFNGIPILENIEIKDITYNSCCIKWDVKNFNFDLNKIKYIIEMKKENENYQKKYE